jgi:indole-3-glycerol phosphate synthase
MILEKIVEDKKSELAGSQQALPQAELMKKLAEAAPTLSFKKALSGPSVRLIAEVKKASPSRGLIRRDFDPLAIARTYQANQAAAISVLTEEKYFLGSLNYLSGINRALGVNRPPLLRKDFIFDEYQIYESRAFGADALLLITAILGFNDLCKLIKLSRQLQMDCLVEVHNEDEVARALAAGADIIGINNRDLRTFEVDLNTTARLRSLVPTGMITVSESGIKSAQDIARLKSWNVAAALVGETLMTSEDIAAKMQELL